MPRTPSAGAPPITLRSWPFGTASRRRLLEVVLLGDPPEQGWTRSYLERRCSVTNGTLDSHLEHLVALHLVRFRDGRFIPLRDGSHLEASLRALLSATARLPEEKPASLPRRTYRQRRRGDGASDELSDDVSVGDAGIESDQELVLRRSNVKGG